jgi:hypothetical protein
MGDPALDLTDQARANGQTGGRFHRRSATPRALTCTHHADATKAPFHCGP